MNFYSVHNKILMREIAVAVSTQDPIYMDCMVGFVFNFEKIVKGRSCTSFNDMASNIGVSVPAIS